MYAATSLVLSLAMWVGVAPSSSDSEAENPGGVDFGESEENASLALSEGSGGVGFSESGEDVQTGGCSAGVDMDLSESDVSMSDAKLECEHGSCEGLRFPESSDDGISDSGISGLGSETDSNSTATICELRDEGDSDSIAKVLLPTPTNLSFCFAWATQVLLFLAQDVGVQGLQQQFCSRTINVSTHFSGIGAAEVAMDMLRATSLKLWGWTLNLVSRSACDNNRRCQNVLQKLLQGV